MADELRDSTTIYEPSLLDRAEADLYRAATGICRRLGLRLNTSQVPNTEPPMWVSNLRDDHGVLVLVVPESPVRREAINAAWMMAAEHVLGRYTQKQQRRIVALVTQGWAYQGPVESKPPKRQPGAFVFGLGEWLEVDPSGAARLRFPY